MAGPLRQANVEFELFSLHAHIDVCRAELEMLAERLEAARHGYLDATCRVENCETPLASRQLEVARRRLHELEGRHVEVLKRIEQLEHDQDALFSKLLR